MSFPNPAERANWFRINRESDALYGPTHRPGVAQVGRAWKAACSCSSGCPAADDDTLHDTWEAAWDSAACVLRAQEHGEVTT